MSDKPYCPWCGRNMDELENGNIDGHAWYRDDSDYIQNIERSRDFMKKHISELKQACLDVLDYADDTVWVNDTETLVDRLVSIDAMSHKEAYGCWG